MLLAVDIGNTNIAFGVFKHEALKGHWRLSTGSKRTADEYGAMLLALLGHAGISRHDLKGAAVASVVPRLTPLFREALSKYFNINALVVTNDNCGIPVLTDNPAEVGADRLVNAVAAYAERRSPLIVVDFGTAVTFDYVTEAGDYAGGIIAPGIGISSEALFKKTARLPRVEPRKPERLIGLNTVESISSGIFYGFISLVDGIIERMMNEAGTGPEVVATGGLAPIVIGESRYVTSSDEFLTLKGLRIIFDGKKV